MKMLSLKLIDAAVAAGLSCTALGAPPAAQGSAGPRQQSLHEQRTIASGSDVEALAQDTSARRATLPQAACGVREARADDNLPADGESIFPRDPCGAIPVSIQFDPLLPTPAVLRGSLAFAQSPLTPPERNRSEEARPISYGVEIGLSSGHADRGIVISDRLVVQPVTWVSGSVATFSVWSNVTLAETTDSSRPQILELELTRAHEWKNFTIEPAMRMFFYRDPLSFYSSRSIEGWLYLTYDAGPFSLVTNHSLDVLTYKGAYFGDAGIEFDRRVSRTSEFGGSFKTGWASATFNDSYVGIDNSALNLISVEGWLTVYVKPRLYMRPFFQFSTIVDRAVRAHLARPTLFFVGLATGVEF